MILHLYSWLICHLLLSLLCLPSLTSTSNASTHLLTKHKVLKPNETGAVCNDGSPAIYYLYNNATYRKWVIYLEGGGGCTSQADCAARFQKTPYFMSSKHYPNQTVPKTIMADSEFDEYNKVLLVYCSSDSWLGDDRTIQKKANETFVFRGAVIFSSILLELMPKGLRKATDVMLIGQSAGGMGVVNHLQFVSGVLPPQCKLSAVLDSSWFIDFDNYFKNSAKPDFMQSTGLTKRNSCRDLSWGFPCCFSTSCMISNSYIPPDIPIFLLQSKYDIYTLFRRFLQQTTHLEDILQTKDILIKVHSYGAQMLQSLDIVSSHSNLKYVFTSCFQHGYLVSSDLWYNVYKADMNLNFPSVQFKHAMNESYWTTINVQGVTLRDAFVSWMQSDRSVNTNKNNQNITNRIKDVCLHAQCNPSCPRVIHFDEYEPSWSFWKKVVLIAVVFFITVACLVTKCLWILQHRNVKKTQALFLNAKYEEGGLFEKVMCLPTCPPHSAIGISCSELEYDITNLNTYSETGTLLRKRNKQQHADTCDGAGALRRRKKSSAMNNKKIIKGVTAYFNPGQLVAIMGPSGSGKTTLLDVITARKHFQEAEANIFINGLQAEETREWFIKNSGYVLQLATPYHEELTVRQNLTYSALMRLPMKMKIQDKMWRVEQVLGQCGLYDVADVVVGDNSLTGGGLSGGQKRRLCIALQLLDLPSVIFLDEPTSGLDSASSLELLETLHSLTLSGRLVVVTIHQPRIEIFHMFDAILFLCDGQVAYFGSPIMAPTMIAQALTGSDQKFDASNPADSIMDVLTNPDSQKIILDYYVQSGEIQAINRAIQRARRHPQKTLSMKFQKQTSSIQNRLLALDGRSSAAQTTSQIFYFPLIYLLYGLALGTCYWQTEKGVLLMSCYMVFSCASQLFLASVIHAHLNKAFALFELEKADGVGHSTELVLHVFIRTFSKSSLPLVMACGIIYLCTIKDYELWKFCLTTLIHLQLNQTWIAIIIFTACSTPRYSSLVTPLLSAISGFAGGFLVPEPQMPMIYYWLFYINPTHWAYSGMMKVLMNDALFECKWSSPLECQSSTGIVVLSEFGFSERNPYLSMFILLVMLGVFLVLSVVVLEIKYSKRKWDKRKKSYWQAITQPISSCYQSIMENYNRKKREAAERERERLLKLVEQQYRYKSDTYDSATAQPITVTYEPLKDHSLLLGNQQQDYLVEGEEIEEVEMIRRNRSNTVNTIGEETWDDSSNDEDIDPTVDNKNNNKNNILSLRQQSALQQSSFSSLFTKLQSGLTSKSGSVDNNSNQNEIGDVIDVRYRKKRRIWKRAFAQRRKTFTGFIKEGEEMTLPKKRIRPQSMLLPQRNGERSAYLKLPRTLSLGMNDSALNSQRPSRANTSSSVNTVIERKQDDLNSGTSLTINRKRDASPSPLLPPDIVIDIEKPVTPEQQTELNAQAIFDVNGIDLKNVSRPHSQISASRHNNSANREKRKKKKDAKSKDTWSKYLNVSPKRHEVYCALNSVKKRLRGSGRGVRGALKKAESVLLQRKASTLLLNEKKDSMRMQLSGLQRAYFHDEGDYSPGTSKRIQLLQTRKKYLKLNSDNEEEQKVFINEPDVEGNGVEDEGGVPKRRRLTGERALLERLSALSSHRSSTRSSIGHTLSSKRSSKSNSGYNIIDSMGDMMRTNSSTSAEIYNVLRKLHSSIDQLEDEDINLNQAESMGMGLNQTAGGGDVYAAPKRRESDPLLPDERDLIEGLLMKYRPHGDSSASNSSRTYIDPLEKQEGEDGAAMYSSKVKIRSASPHHSRKTSEDRSKRSQSILLTVNKSDLIEELNENSKDDNNRPVEHVPSLNKIITIKNMEDQHIDAVKKVDNAMTTNKSTTPKVSRARKMSTVKEVAKMFEVEPHQNNKHPSSRLYNNSSNEPKFTIVPEQHNYEVSSESDSAGTSNSSSSSSDYEEDIVKTNEGFIIPDDAVSKLNKLNIDKAIKARRLQEEQEEIERQFKKENFLKDRPARRGIRMPVGSAGKVNQLKSKFEGKLIANAIVNEKRRSETSKNHNQNPSSTTEQQLINTQPPPRTPNISSPSATGGKQRNFFKKRRQFSRSTDTNSDSDDTIELTPVTKHSILGGITTHRCEDTFSSSTSHRHQHQDKRYTVVELDSDSEDTYYRQHRIYERDSMNAHMQYNKNGDFVPCEFYASDEDGESSKLDSISIYSCNSDRKRTFSSISSRTRDWNEYNDWIE